MGAGAPGAPGAPGVAGAPGAPGAPVDGGKDPLYLHWSRGEDSVSRPPRTLFASCFYLLNSCLYLLFIHVFCWGVCVCVCARPLHSSLRMLHLEIVLHHAQQP